MSSTMTEPISAGAIEPIGLGPGEGENLWFLGILVTIKSAAETTGGAVTVIEHYGPRGSGSPLHMHTREDEWFYVIEGELAFWVGGRRIAGPAGSGVFGPRNIPHTFTVRSEVARWLLVTNPAGFEDFMRRFASPAERLEIPPPDVEWPDPAVLAEVARDYGIQVLGPPGIPLSGGDEVDQDRETVVRRMYEAFTARDVLTAFELMAEDIDWFESEGLPWGGRKLGAATVAQEVFGPTVDAVPDIAITIEQIIPTDGETVAVAHRYTGTSKSGRRLDVAGAGFWDVRDGKIVRYRQFVDTMKFAEAMATEAVTAG
jgi:ketosteroid isomerase-like protein/quercetin dioxygenase-like cupin family protein